MTLHAQTFCHVYCNRMETTYASGVARCDNWKAFVSVLYSKCETGATAGILYIAIRRDSTRHRTRDIRPALRPLFGLKSLMRKFLFVRLEAAFFFGFSLKNLLSRIMQFMIYIFYVTIFTFCFIFVQITNWLQCLFIFALVWSIGGTINGDSRKKFDAFFRLLISGTDKDHPKPNNIKMTKVTGQFYSRVLYKTRPVKL